MARVSICSLIMFLAAVATGGEVGRVVFVESVPVETEDHLDLPDLPHAADAWLDLVQGAQRSLDIFSFYVSPDPDQRCSLQAVLDAVEARARGGVAVRLLSDAKFHRTYPETHDRFATLDHIDARLIDGNRAWGGGVLHAKGMIIDGERFFLGSQNWDWRALEHIHELGVMVEHQALAADLARLYDLDWQRAGAPDGPPPASAASAEASFAPVRALALPDGRICDAVLAASPPHALPAGIPWDLPLLIDQIDRASERVRLQMLSYKPGDRDDSYWGELDQALRRAAARGCEVQIIMSNWSKRDSVVPHLKSLTVLPRIDVRFTNIPEWSGGFIPFARVDHAKYVTCDGNALWLGTSNGSRDYFYQSRNVSLFLRGDGAAEAADRFFEISWTSPYAEHVDPCAAYEPPRRQ